MFGIGDDVVRSACEVHERPRDGRRDPVVGRENEVQKVRPASRRHGSEEVHKMRAGQRSDEVGLQPSTRCRRRRRGEFRRKPVVKNEINPPSALNTAFNVEYPSIK